MMRPWVALMDLMERPRLVLMRQVGGPRIDLVDLTERSCVAAIDLLRGYLVGLLDLAKRSRDEFVKMWLLADVMRSLAGLQALHVRSR